MKPPSVPYHDMHPHTISFPSPCITVRSRHHSSNSLPGSLLHQCCASDIQKLNFDSSEYPTVCRFSSDPSACSSAYYLHFSLCMGDNHGFRRRTRPGRPKEQSARWTVRGLQCGNMSRCNTVASSTRPLLISRRARRSSRWSSFFGRPDLTLLALGSRVSCKSRRILRTYEAGRSTSLAMSTGLAPRSSMKSMARRFVGADLIMALEDCEYL